MLSTENDGRQRFNPAGKVSSRFRPDHGEQIIREQIIARSPVSRCLPAANPTVSAVGALPAKR